MSNSGKSVFAQICRYKTHIKNEQKDSFSQVHLRTAMTKFNVIYISELKTQETLLLSVSAFVRQPLLRVKLGPPETELPCQVHD